MKLEAAIRNKIDQLKKDQPDKDGVIINLKLKNLLLKLYENYLYESYKYENELIDLTEFKDDWDIFLYGLYIKDNREFLIRLNELKAKRLIDFPDDSVLEGNNLPTLKTNNRGFIYLESIQSNTENK